jgi:hypothetical protein
MILAAAITTMRLVSLERRFWTAASGAKLPLTGMSVLAVPA